MAGSACHDAAVCHDGEQWVISGDPTEAAMKVVALKTAAASSIDEDYPRIATIPFDSRRQRMATLHRRTADGQHLVFVTGATEGVVELCSSWMRADETWSHWTSVPSLRPWIPWLREGCGFWRQRSRFSVTSDDLSADGIDGEVVLTGLQAVRSAPVSSPGSPPRPGPRRSACSSP